jgi:hypothetical protein
METRTNGLSTGGCRYERTLGYGLVAQSDSCRGSQFLCEVPATSVEVGDEVFLGCSP